MEYQRTWNKYPEIQKDFPYSDQCISALIEIMKRTEWYAESIIPASSTKTIPLA
jgi:hypothetical protein